ncbi:MAG: SDR family oxidoreductase [Gammaproteobacteria bacterium]|nr:SDR family oxidoreductase [Gammaproteobacteria bacterium]MYH14006.1 SDR family oxidoreductase [Gammaproteobacteria bacterium]MYK84240.1 SDR family oxidoreductase [Gammaproteobacteria bacterium]
MAGRVAGKVALVTGGAKGLGEADARALAAEGAQVVLTDVDEAGGQAVADDIGAVFKPQDVTDEARWQTIIDEIQRDFGALHVLVNNAGIVLPGSIESQTYAQYQAQMTVMADGTFLGSKYAIPLMAASGGGSIINMASVVSKLAYSGVVSYAAAKGAIEGMSRSIAAHCLESGYRIRCNSIHPGIINTPMVQNFGAQAGDVAVDAPQPPEGPLPAEAGVLGAPRNIADLVVFLASDESAFITAQEFVIDGGMSMLPAPLVHELQ